MSIHTVGDLVAEFLEACRLDTLFGMVSVHNLPVLDAVARRGYSRFISARGEMGGGHMADGYARATGRLGVLVTSTGPGAASACPALVEAEFAGTPLLHITGQSLTPWIGSQKGALHDVKDQAGMLGAVCKATFRIHSPAEALGVLTKAAVTALSPRQGPVSVEIPFDVQRMEAPCLDPASFSLPLPALRILPEAEFEPLVQTVLHARQPVIWVGSGARDATAAVKELADLGFAVVNSLSAQGLLPGDHPMNLGSLNGSREPNLDAFYDQCDLMIVAGARLRLNETRDGASRLPANRVQIDIDVAAQGRTYGCSQFACADVNDTLTRLAARLRANAYVAAPDFAQLVADVRQTSQEALRTSLGPYADFPRQMRAAMPDRTVWVRDATLSNGSWGNRLFPLSSPRDGMFPIGAGIGPGLPLGIGAALGVNSEGRKVVMMAGDGGFAVNLTELWVATQEQADMVIVVMNDSSYGVIRHIQNLSYGGRNPYTALQQPDYEGLARLAHIPFWRVSRADDLEASMREALAVDGPAFVEVDMRAIGDFPSYIVPQK